ncbi:MAG: hypothetical protein J7598_01945 [Mitsuaria chitosanitabida]|uniref:hypothetical protein n=1 Tax=Roseateles chitosanitabidus TaxID=65048 RepID=UPI001B10DFFC|nr:hypothetical protein [Roseateles chitosanitabidus]MBO9685350.1 hypothetical protein [Roseateles chitosanitabidus]
MNPSTLLDPLHDAELDGLDFARTAFRLFDEVYNLADDGNTLRQRKGDVGRLVEEVLPIARYLLSNYGAGQYIRVRWMRGSQQFDATVTAHGARIDHQVWPTEGALEVTTALHPNSYLMRELLNAKGGCFGLDGLSRLKDSDGSKAVSSVPTSHTNSDFVADMAGIVISAVRAKIAKRYPPGTTLIVSVELNNAYSPQEWEQLLRLVREERMEHSFRQVFLSADQGVYTANL